MPARLSHSCNRGHLKEPRPSLSPWLNRRTYPHFSFGLTLQMHEPQRHSAALIWNKSPFHPPCSNIYSPLSHIGLQPAWQSQGTHFPSRWVRYPCWFSQISLFQAPPPNPLSMQIMPAVIRTAYLRPPSLTMMSISPQRTLIAELSSVFLLIM